MLTKRLMLVLTKVYMKKQNQNLETNDEVELSIDDYGLSYFINCKVKVPFTADPEQMAKNTEVISKHVISGLEFAGREIKNIELHLSSSWESTTATIPIVSSIVKR